MSGISLHRLWRPLLACALLLPSAPGCATFWEEAWSKERDFAYMTGFGKPHPMVVLRDSNNGLRRGQALAELREPLQNGGTAQDQEAYLKVLEAAALGIYDPDNAYKDEPYARLTAVRTLGKFRDPRAARILEDVYQQPARNPELPHLKQGMPFIPDNNNLIRKEALAGLENMKDEQARHLLIRVAPQPGPPVDASFADAQQTQDEKIVAIRPLGKYRHQECADALKYVLQTERDIALRDRALASLEEMTGKSYPAAIEAWQAEEIRPQPAAGNNFIERVGASFKQ